MTNPRMVMFSADDSARVRRFMRQVGNVRQACARLGIADSTFDAARDQGRVQSKTREKVLAALARERA